LKSAASRAVAIGKVIAQDAAMLKVGKFNCKRSAGVSIPLVTRDQLTHTHRKLEHYSKRRSYLSDFPRVDPLSLGKSLRSCSVAFHSVREYHLANIIIERTIRQWSDKSNLEDVLTKVVLVDSLYHTNVLDVWKIA